MEYNEHYNFPNLVHLRDEGLDMALALARKDNNHEAAGREHANAVIEAADMLLIPLNTGDMTMSEMAARDAMRDPDNQTVSDLNGLISAVKAQIEKDPSIFSLAELLRRHIPPQPWPKRNSEVRAEQNARVERANELGMDIQDYMELAPILTTEANRERYQQLMDSLEQRGDKKISPTERRQLAAWKKYNASVAAAS